MTKRKRTLKLDLHYAPVTKLIIHEVQYFEKDQLLYSMGHGVEAGNIGRGLFWHDGIAFAYSVAPLQEVFIDDYLRGTMHITSLVFTEWPEYVSYVEIPQSKVRIPFWKINLVTAKILVAWLKRELPQVKQA